MQACYFACCGTEAFFFLSIQPPTSCSLDLHHREEHSRTRSEINQSKFWPAVTCVSMTKDLKSKNKKWGGFALVINTTTKRHNFPKYAVKRRQMPSKASWCLWPLLWLCGCTLPARGAAPAGSSIPGSSTCWKHPAPSGVSKADCRAQLTCLLLAGKIHDPEVLL